MGKLYEWQSDCLKKWENNGRRGIVNAITGSGKTTLALSAIYRAKRIFKSLHTKIIVPTTALARQWEASVFLELKEKPGLFCGTRKDDPSSPVMIYVINSARYSLSRHILDDFAQNRPVLLILDECHHYGSEENKRIFDFLKGLDEKENIYFSMGLSATPFSPNSKKLLEWGIGQEIYRYDIQKGLNEKIISPFCVFQVRLSFSGEERQKYLRLSEQLGIIHSTLIKEYPYLKKLSTEAFFSALQKISGGDLDSDDPATMYLLLSYQRKEISLFASSRIACAKKLLSILRDDEKIIIFCERIAQAEELYSVLSKYTCKKYGIYHSEMTADARKRALDSFKDNLTHVLISCKALDEGLDVPDASIAIVLSTTSMQRQRIQRLGRILRKSGQKSLAALYYLYLNESSDDCAYLADHEGFVISHAKYSAEEDSFIFEAYEEAAAKLLTYAKEKKNASPAVLEELNSCLWEGMMRPDFLLPRKICGQNRLNASSTHEKNYWMCMEKMCF